ncbi:hypothetical protein FCV43_03280 [Vibrio genomosp. F6]|uniref:hypothetical protein n=1 Tax=Vibrio genomosp. F6 TaxID=723172 RepID=UPI0010BD37EA|nr:hypothetical protein [Vibrio genomosp. F6]TKF23446.1 hypothetical protein FCV43_03280 [Vibrio genomosp. F6]
MLIVDFGFHFKQMIHASHYWGESETVVLAGHENIATGKFRRIHRFSRKLSSLKILFLMLGFLVKGKDVVVLTAPEYGSRYYDKLIQFLFFLVTHTFGKKITLYIKNTHIYEKNSFLKHSIKNVKELHFESYTQMDYFRSKLNCKSKCIVSYVYYPDLLDIRNESNIRIVTKKRIVGLVGQFDSERRNYDCLFSLSDEFFNKFEIVQIGRIRFNHSDTMNVYTKLYNKGIVTFIKDDYTTSEIDYLISKSDILLSLNSSDFNYDKGKGTAVFSEAISQKKKLVTPSFLPQNEEFLGFCTPYDNDLKTAIYNSLEKEVCDTEWHKYSISYLRGKV